MSPAAVAVVVLLLAVGMVSRWALPNIRGKNLVTAMIVVGIFNYTLVMLRPNWWTVGWWNVWNVVILLAARAEDRAEEAVNPADA